jgi:organic hydroperoxide reductase OsmC/OhrA
LKTHNYCVETRWTGNLGSGTPDYRAYRRDHEITVSGKTAVIQGSSDAAFRGDASRYNPEELLVASLSTCHMLWVLHLCADAGIVITQYSDTASGTMIENSDGAGQFTEVVLHPQMTITDAERANEATAIHHKAHEMCFIARSVNFPVRAEPTVNLAS